MAYRPEILPRPLRPGREPLNWSWGMNRKHIGVALLLMLFTSLCAFAQDDTESNPRKWGDYTVQQSIEFGGRIADINGNQQMYDTFTNLHSGPRLFSQELSLRAAPGTGKLFDSLYLSSFGFGGDPDDLARLRVHKEQWYDFTGLYRRDRNFFDVNLFANPLTLNNPANLVTNNAGQLSPYLVNSPHYQSTTRNMGDFNLTLFPQKVISIRLGYARNNNQGVYDSTIHENNEFDLTDPNYRDRSDRYTFGLDFRGLKRTTISFDQYYEHDIVNGNWMDNPYGFSLNGASVDPGIPLQTVATMGTSGCQTAGVLNLANGGIVLPACNNGTFFYNRYYNVRTNIPTSQLSLRSNYFRKLDITALGVYSSATSDLRGLNDIWRGLGTHAGQDLYQITGPATAKRISTSADLGLTYHFTRTWSASDTFRWIDWREPGTFNPLQINCYPPTGATLSSTIGSPCPLSGLVANGLLGTAVPGVGTSAAVLPSGQFFGTLTSYIQFLGERDFYNTITLNWQPNRYFGGFIGYRYGRRELRELDGTGAGTNFITATSTGVGTPVTVPGSLEPAETLRERLNEHTALIGFVVRPTERWRINTDAEILYTDNAFTQIAPRHQQRVRVNTVYQLKRWASVHGSAHIIESRDDFATNLAGVNLFPVGDIPAYGNKNHNRYYTFGVTLTNSRVTFDGGYTYMDQKILSASCVPVSGVTPVLANGSRAPMTVCPTIVLTEADTPVAAGEPTISGGLPSVLNYTEKTNTFYANLSVKPVKRVTVNVGYQLTSDAGSNIWTRGDNGQPLLFAVDSNFNIVAPGASSAVAILPGPNPLVPSGQQTFNWHQPFAGVEIALSRGFAFKGNWAYFDYNEKADFQGPVVPRDFHAHTGTLALKYSF